VATGSFNALLKSLKRSFPLLRSKKKIIKAKVVSNSLEFEVKIRKSFAVSPEFGDRGCSGS
jgi:hypothetical protein